MREWASKRSNLQFDWCLNFYWSALQWNCVCNCIVHWHWLCVIVGCRHALVHSFKCITFLLTLARVCVFSFLFDFIHSIYRDIFVEHFYKHVSIPSLSIALLLGSLHFMRSHFHFTHSSTLLLAFTSMDALRVPLCLYPHNVVARYYSFNS